ncbi:MAG: ABC transporter ATP-binding protein [Candidatus Beckwithbacteria bacterium]|nr:ABC transporter ATP-binding protein [Candidatus Beckwithbacteria bacterium]
MLKVQNLKVKVQNKLILDGINLQIERGEIVALMGPNGSGKSSLANAIMGNPSYQLVSGQASLDGENLLNLGPDKRAKIGLFLAWQNPIGIRGVTVGQIVRKPRKELLLAAKDLKIKPEFLEREINVGFSGGEKKKLEILQLIMLKPKYAILDEIDSGLDIDALKLLGEIKQKKLGILLITHYTRIFKYLKPDRVLVMKEGRIVKSGGKELIKIIEKDGYGNF